jgi:hypothetical protein
VPEYNERRISQLVAGVAVRGLTDPEIVQKAQVIARRQHLETSQRQRLTEQVTAALLAKARRR